MALSLVNQTAHTVDVIVDLRSWYSLMPASLTHIFVEYSSRKGVSGYIAANLSARYFPSLLIPDIPYEVDIHVKGMLTIVDFHQDPFALPTERTREIYGTIDTGEWVVGR